VASATLVFCLAVSALSEPAPRASPAQTGDRLRVPITAKDLSLGPPGAPVTIIEFSDFQCPFCRRAEPTVVHLLAQFAGRIRFIHRDLPLDIHLRSFPAAEAAHCAAEQQRFWDMRRALLGADASLDDETLRQAAAAAGLQGGPFAACIASHRYRGLVQDSVNEALRLGLYTTPTFVINGRVFVGFASPQALQQAVNDALAARH
jgi:protein-disulfide isomerase